MKSRSKISRTIWIPAALIIFLILPKAICGSNSYDGTPVVQCSGKPLDHDARICIKTALLHLDQKEEILSWDPIQNAHVSLIPENQLEKRLKRIISKKIAPELTLKNVHALFRKAVLSEKLWTWNLTDSLGDARFEVPFGKYWICVKEKTHKTSHDLLSNCSIAEVRTEDQLALLALRTQTDPQTILTHSNLENSSQNDLLPYEERFYDFIHREVKEKKNTYGYISIETDLSAEIEIWPTHNKRNKIKLHSPIKKLLVKPGRYKVKVKNNLAQVYRQTTIRVRPHKINRLKYELKALLKRK